MGGDVMSEVMANATPTSGRIDPSVSRRGFLASAAAAGAAGAWPAAGNAQERATRGSARSLKVLSAGSALYGMRPCAEAFTRRTGIAVAVATDHGHNIHKAALEGRADADVVLLPTEWVDEMVAKGFAERETIVAIGAVRIGAAVREGAPRPDVSSMDALRRTLIAADAVLLTLAPTGDHLMQVIERMGLADTVKAKLKRFDTATLLNKHLVENAGPGALGFGPATEIMVWRGKGVAWAGAIPDEIQIVLPYAGAMLTRTQAKDDARALLAFIASAEARQHFLDSGVE
jgi:molybdate transport system substrate-binding protein